MENRCVCCGEIIPEGRQVCPRCEKDVESEDDLISRQQAIEAVKRIIHAGLSEEAIYAEIEQIPKAYDKEKVIGKLEELRVLDFLTIANTGDEKLDCAYEYVSNALDHAIKIIKKGGI